MPSIPSLPDPRVAVGVDTLSVAVTEYGVVIGESEDRKLVDWRKREVDGTTVYELEYSDTVSAPETPSRGALAIFSADSGGTVPMGEQRIELPDGERIPAREATFEAEGTTLRVRRDEPSLLARIAGYLWR